MRLIALYARVSTAEQANEGYSIDEQIDRLRKFCESQGRKDVTNYIDAGFTGANINRPAMQKLIKDVKDGKIDKVVVWKLDRLSRSQKDTLFLIEDVFLKNGADFESMNERFDTASSFGRAMIGILSVFAQLEREQIKERMAMGKEGRAKEGKFHGGGHDPIGYKYIDGELKVDDYESIFVKQIFNDYASGKSAKQIEKELMESGFRPRGAYMSHNTIRRMLKNNVYIGMIKHKDGAFQGLHKPIIDKDTFEAVQHRLKVLSEDRKRDTAKETLLQGMVYCARCGAKYACTAHSADAGHKYRYYTCYSRRKINLAMVKDPNCRNKNFRVDILDGLILGEIEKLSVDPSLIDSIVEDSKQSRGTDNETEVKAYEDRLRTISEQSERLITLFQMDGINLESIQERMQALNKEREHIQGQIEALNDHRSVLSAERVHSIVKSFSDIVKRQETGELRVLVETLIEKIEIDGEDIKIFWKF